MGEDTWLFGLFHCSTRDMSRVWNVANGPKTEGHIFVDFINFFVCSQTEVHYTPLSQNLAQGCF
jgi:hypothetical protein